jgi:hypothetical protein
MNGPVYAYRLCKRHSVPFPVHPKTREPADAWFRQRGSFFRNPWKMETRIQARPGRDRHENCGNSLLRLDTFGLQPEK